MLCINRMAKSFGRGGLLTALFVAATLLSVAAASAAGPVYWDCYSADSSFLWSNSDIDGGWTRNGVAYADFPNSTVNTQVAIDHGATVTLNGSYSAETMYVGGWVYSGTSATLGGEGTLVVNTSATTLTLGTTWIVGGRGFGGTVLQSDGAVISGGDLLLGGNGGSGGGAANTGYYYQSGGTNSCHNLNFGYGSGAAYGKYVQDGGELTITTGLSGMAFGYGTAGTSPGGEYHLNGGKLNLDVSLIEARTYGAAIFEFGGGTMIVDRDAVSSGFDAAHPMSLKAGTTSAVDPNGHTMEFQNGLTGAGAITLGGASGGTVIFSGPNDYTGATTLIGGTLKVGSAAQNAVFNLGGVDVANADARLVFDYSGGSTPAATVVNLLHDSYATGWTGGQLRCSIADDAHGLGWTDDPNASQLTVLYAFYGDANLDNTVNLLDLAELGANWHGVGRSWEQGDFNYDGVVNLLDLAMLGANWHASAAGMSFSEALKMVNFATVPEPGTAALLGFALLGLLGIAKKRCKRD